MNQNFQNLIDTHVSPIINVNDLKNHLHNMQTANETAFSYGLMYAKDVQKFKNVVTSPEFKQIAKATFAINENLEYYYTNVLQISKVWASKLVKIAECGDEQINDYKSKVKAENESKGTNNGLTLNGLYNFLQSKETAEPKEKTFIEKVEKLLEKDVTKDEILKAIELLQSKL